MDAPTAVMLGERTLLRILSLLTAFSAKRGRLAFKPLPMWPMSEPGFQSPSLLTERHAL